MDRSEHLAWAKKRALEYLELPTPDPAQALTSMVSDLNKHDDLRGHPGIALSAFELHRLDPRQIRNWIESFN